MRIDMNVHSIQMKRYFTLWCGVLFAFFVIANLAGYVRSRGLLQFRYSGFPYTFTAWGYIDDAFFDLSILLLNFAIAVTVSVIVAMLLTYLRHRKTV